MTEARDPELGSPLAAFFALYRWYRPYLAGMRGLIGWTIAGTLVFLACVAVTPLVVEWILHHGTWDTTAIVGLLLLVALQLVVSYYAHIGAHRVANESASRLRLRVFDRALASRIARQERLGRSSIVGRHTDDVDRIADAVEKTLAQGLPGIIRVVQSLVLLTIIETIAGIAMTIAAIAFLLLHHRIGQRLIRVDHERTHASSDLATNVDESISTSRLLAGLRLGTWQRGRFARLVERLEHTTHEQGIQVSRLILGAHAAGLVGLVVVTVAAVLLGGENLAGVAAAILYVEGVVVGLEALPPWVRSVQLGVVSQQRIDTILDEPDRVADPAGTPSADAIPGLAATGLELRLESGVTLRDADLVVPPGAVVGVVSSPWPEADSLVAALAGDVNPTAGTVTLGGVDVRSAAVRSRVAFVPDETAGFDVSALDELRAADPDLSLAGACDLLARFGLAHLAARPDDLATPLGPGGNLLAVNDRQLLNLAVAVASRPRVLLAGSLIPLGEADVALPLVTALREQEFEATVLCVRDPVVAEAMDLIVFLDHDAIAVGTHHDLLLTRPAYARLWEQRLSGADVDLSVLGLADGDEAALFTRLVTESYAAGDPIYRQGAPADRLLFIITGQVGVTVTDAEGRERRTAVLGPGNHCGDLSLTVGETRAESAWALTPVVVRALSREAITAGLTGLLDRPPTERRIVASLLRSGPATADELRERLPDVEPLLFASSLALLLKDGAVREAEGVVTAVQRRQAKAGAAALLDRLGDL